eukprot:7544807-Pyramimonas_sp.AAC.1
MRVYEHGVPGNAYGGGGAAGHKHLPPPQTPIWPLGGFRSPPQTLVWALGGASATCPPCRGPHAVTLIQWP